ncbi:hypothetical protein GVAV_001133 [Gurleya vavrai]
MIDEIKNELIKIGGNFQIAIHYFSNKTHYLFILFQNKENPTIIAAILLQHSVKNKQNYIGNILYIEGLDTTGYFQPRNHQSKIIKTFTKAILKSCKYNFLACFVHPKKEIFFGKSSENSEKRILKPKDLLEYWIGIFDKIDGKLYVYSNYYPVKSHPYTEMNIKPFLFNDDPIAKHSNENNTTDEIFNIVEYSKDFKQGSLLYMKNENEQVNVECKNDDVDKIIDFLRKGDFSNVKNCREVSINLIKKFEIELDWFETEKNEIVSIFERKKLKQLN